MKVKARIGIFLLTLGILSSSCHPSSGLIDIDFDKLPYKYLSQYNFFIGPPGTLLANEGVLPYDIVTPLFSDYAHKTRFIYIPKGATAVMDSTGTIDFPEGSVLIKNFLYPEDFSLPDKIHDLVETRLLVFHGTKWQPYTYIWDDKEKDAVLSDVGGYVDVSWIDINKKKQNIQYAIPDKNQCKGCHDSSDELLPIGPKYRSLNRIYDYAGGPENQISRWVRAGILKIPTRLNTFTLARWDDEYAAISSRALAYLEINCGHCHDEKGRANTSGLYLNTDKASAIELGICKTPVAAGKGAGNRLYSIVPGKPDKSILMYRIESNDPGVMMPELGRTIIHHEGNALIKAWITTLDGDCTKT